MNEVAVGGISYLDASGGRSSCAAKVQASRTNKIFLNNISTSLFLQKR